MADQPQDAPNPPRRSGVLPPFIAPRTTGASAPVQPPGAPRRRTSQLFTPPGIPRQSRPITPSWQRAAAPERASSPAVAPDSPAPEPAAVPRVEPPAPTAEQTWDDLSPPADGGAVDASVVEATDAKAANLPSTGEQRAVTDVEVIAFDDPGALLESHTAPGEARRVAGLEIEDTEWTMGEPAERGALEVENFHAAQPLSPAAPEVTTGAPSAGPTDALDEEPRGDERDLSWSDAFADSDWFAPEPEPEAAPPQPADPRGAEFSAALAWPDADEVGGQETPVEAPRAVDGDALASVAPDLRDSSAPWAETPAQGAEWEGNGAGVPPAGDAARQGVESEGSAEVDPRTPPPSPGAADPAATVAESLERIAKRVREGEVVLPADSAPPSDESALALALAALLRGAIR